MHEGRIYQLKLFCGKDYPDNPPTVRFQTRINMTCVNQETGMVSNVTRLLVKAMITVLCFYFFGRTVLCFCNKFVHGQIYQVEPSLFPMLANWQREYTMEDILTQLKKDMMSPQNRKLAQPPEGLLIFFLFLLFAYFLLLINKYICFIISRVCLSEVSSFMAMSLSLILCLKSKKNEWVNDILLNDEWTCEVGYVPKRI